MEHSHTIGDIYQGGIIFWLDVSSAHGLIASRLDQSEESIWGGMNLFISALGDDVYAGNLNTTKAVAKLIDQNFASLAAANYKVKSDGLTACDLISSTEECYGDWYLPSRFELNLMYEQKLVIGGFSDSYYWSSTELNDVNAWGQYFGNGETRSFSKNSMFRIRPIRSF